MAFIVEMIRGRHNKLEVNQSGKLQIGNIKDEDFEMFQCSGSIWEGSLLVGRLCGWEPYGSVLSNSVGTDKEIIGDYKPSSWNSDGVYKVFVSKDALAFAKSLESFVENFKDKPDAKISSVLASAELSLEEIEKETQWLSVEFLRKFITFLRKGEFIFVWDD